MENENSELKKQKEAEDICMSCGACCQTYRVSFHWKEAETLDIPEDLIEPVNNIFVCLAGTNLASPRCNMLDGKVGEKVKCNMYEKRPSPCHEVKVGDDKCNRARLRHGLPPITPS